MTTLGVGDFVAATTSWRYFSVFLSLTGFVLITTGISYMVPALSAVVKKRKVGSYISLLGTTPQDIIKNFWQGARFEGFESHFNALTEMIIEHNQQMLAYPVIYCFYTTSSKKAAVLNIVKLDEALSIILKLVPEDKKPSVHSIRPLRNAITDFISIQKSYFIELESEELLLPNVIELSEAGIPLRHNQNSLAEVYQELSNRRKSMRSLLKDQGRDFDNVFEERYEED